MRALIMVAITVLALSACRNNDQHDNTMNVDENLTAESIVSNDVTAIDAVTGDAANMAADINYTDTSDNSVAASPQGQPAAKMPKSRPATSQRATESNSPPPTNTADNGTE
jgi:hypothetical protein